MRAHALYAAFAYHALKGRLRERELERDEPCASFGPYEGVRSQHRERREHEEGPRKYEEFLYGQGVEQKVDNFPEHYFKVPVCIG